MLKQRTLEGAHGFLNDKKAKGEKARVCLVSPEYNFRRPADSHADRVGRPKAQTVCAFTLAIRCLTNAHVIRSDLELQLQPVMRQAHILRQGTVGFGVAEI